MSSTSPSFSSSCYLLSPVTSPGIPIPSTVLSPSPDPLQSVLTSPPRSSDSHENAPNQEAEERKLTSVFKKVAHFRTPRQHQLSDLLHDLVLLLGRQSLVPLAETDFP